MASVPASNGLPGQGGAGDGGAPPVAAQAGPHPVAAAATSLPVVIPGVGVGSVPVGAQTIVIEGVTVHVSPDVMFNRTVHKPAWHQDAHRSTRKDMIQLM